MSDIPVPDIVAHEHTCPTCHKKTHCTLDECEDVVYIICVDCDDDDYDTSLEDSEDNEDDYDV